MGNILELKEAEANLLVAEEKWELAWEVFDELHSSLANVGHRLFLRYTLIEWAKAHLLRGEKEDKQRARELFEEALKVSEEMGAVGWVEYLKEEIAKLG